MAIHVGDDLRVVAEHSTWRVERRRVAEESGKERWETVGHFVDLHAAFKIGCVGSFGLEATGIQDEVRRVGNFMDAMQSLAYNMGQTSGQILDLAWAEAARQWQSLGVDGVPADPRVWTNEQWVSTWNALKEDNECIKVLNHLAVLTNWDNLRKKIEAELPK